MTEYLLLLVSTVLINNFVLVKFLGLCPFMGVSGKLETAVGMGLATMFVLPPSIGDLEGRLRTRAQDSAVVIASRMAKPQPIQKPSYRLVRWCRFGGHATFNERCGEGLSPIYCQWRDFQAPFARRHRPFVQSPL